MKTVELSVNYCLFIIISHGEILKLHSILVHAEFWSVDNFSEFYSFGYIFIYFIVSIYPIYSSSDLPIYVLHVGCRCPWRGWSPGSLLRRQFEPPTWAFRLGQPLGFHKSYQRLAMNEHDEQCRVIPALSPHWVWPGSCSVSSTSASGSLHGVHWFLTGLVEWLKNTTLSVVKKEGGQPYVWLVGRGRGQLGIPIKCGSPESLSSNKMFSICCWCVGFVVSEITSELQS